MEEVEMAYLYALIKAAITKRYRPGILIDSLYFSDF